ncbi:MAG TPA: DUF3999 domain-containing protein [Methylothermaceae bacterium]|nr:DUF3999 domain-containing protein [Methylothermaceae bacterium]
MNRCLQNLSSTLLFSIALLACPSVPASPEQPKPEDFAWGFPVIVDTQSDIYQVTLPESLYRAVASPQLADLRVFDGRGSLVPFLLIPPKTDETPPPAPIPVPFFPLYRSREQADPANIRIETARSGAILQIHSDSANEQNRVLWGYLIDLGEERQAIRGLKLQWQDAGDNLMTRVRLEQSDDLSMWRPLGTPATVVSLRFDGHRIKRNQVSFSASPQRYLRLHWPAGAQGIELVQIHALVSQTRPAPQITWITLKPIGKEEDDGQRHYLYDSGGLFPVTRLQVRLPGDNVLATIRIESRSQPEGPWRLRHQGLVYSVSVQGNTLVNETIAIPTTSDRTWRLTVTKALGLVDPPPSLQLGWQPHRLRFLASGHPPYLIACGNARMPPLPPSFQHTLKTLLGKTKDVSVATATIGPRQPLGDPSLLSPPRIVPWRRWLLWAVLFLGVGTIALMVRRLVREMRQP